MLEIAIAGYCIYFLVSFYTTFMQIDYVKRAKNGNVVILSNSKFKEAGNYSIESQKLALATTFYDFVLFFIWISFGLQYLDSLTAAYIGWQKAVIFTSENPVPDPEIQCVQKCRSTLVESANFLLTNFRKNNTYRKNNEREVKFWGLFIFE